LLSAATLPTAMLPTATSRLQDVAGIATAASDARSWTQILSRYRDPNFGRAAFELAVTIVPFVLLWFATWIGLYFGYWICLLLAIPAAGFLVRLFMIQHDCGHGSFFRQRLVNDWLGRVIGVLTMTPYDYWRGTHSIHHATSGNLDRRGIGDIDTKTVREYLAMSRWGRLRYRLYRHPAVMFGFGPAYLFLIQHRLPFGLMRGGWRPWVSTVATNLAIALVIVTVVWFIGLRSFLLIQTPIILLAASAGVWLFYVQHQFEDTDWAEDSSWNFHESALRGSSYYDLPPPISWFTANIGVHHVHHLCSRIPFYRLRRVLRNYPELAKMRRLTLLQSFGCVRLTLWDETKKKLVSFRDIRDARRAARSSS
jgi:acyl-lipid omega-6 desaturase (Delta-12 desaturase)